jgi:protein CpxP
MKLAHLLFASALLFAGPLPALAQPDGPPQLSRLHDALRLRPDQEPAWQSFERASAMDAQEAARQQSAFENMRNLKAPQRMDLSIQMMRTDLESMQRRSEALKSFYASLSPSQQAIFDRETLRAPE